MQNKKYLNIASSHLFAVILTYPPPISRFSSLTPQLQTMEQPLLEQIRIVRCCCSPRTLKAWLPILSWLPRYNLRWLQMDLMAGLTVGLTVVPQALAYAEVAALPVQVNDFFLLPFLSYITFLFSLCVHHSAFFSPQYGLYSAFMGGFIYTLLGTSKDVTLGPTAIMSLLCFSVVGGQPHRAVLLSLLCGLIQAGMALLRLGKKKVRGSHVTTLWCLFCWLLCTGSNKVHSSIHTGCVSGIKKGGLMKRATEPLPTTTDITSSVQPHISWVWIATIYMF